MSYSLQTCPAVLGSFENDFETLVIGCPATDESCRPFGVIVAAVVVDFPRFSGRLELPVANPLPAAWPLIPGAVAELDCGLATGPVVKALPGLEKFVVGAEGNVGKLDGLLNWVPSWPALLNELAEELIPAFCLGWLNDARNGVVFGGIPVAVVPPFRGAGTVAGVGVEGVPSVVVAGAVAGAVVGTVAGVGVEGVPSVVVAGAVAGAVAGTVAGGVTGVVGGGVQPCCALTKLAELAHRHPTMTDNAVAKRSVG